MIVAQNPDKLSWRTAYRNFRHSPDESWRLKYAPLAIVLVLLPADIAANFLVVLGLPADAGTFAILVAVAVKTMRRVRHYRRPAWPNVAPPSRN